MQIDAVIRRFSRMLRVDSLCVVEKPLVNGLTVSGLLRPWHQNVG